MYSVGCTCVTLCAVMYVLRGLLWTVFVSLSFSRQANETAVMFHRIVSVQWAKVNDGSQSKYTVYSSLVFIHSFSYLIPPLQAVLVFVVCSVFLSMPCPLPPLVFVFCFCFFSRNCHLKGSVTCFD